MEVLNINLKLSWFALVWKTMCIMKKYIIYWRYRGCANTSTHIEFVQSEDESNVSLEMLVVEYLTKKYNYNSIVILYMTCIDSIDFATV